MSLLRQFLLDGGTLNDLLVKYAIKATRHKDYPSLCLLKYNQIDSPFAEPIVREARGIILDEKDNWRVVSRSFDKFFNHGEGHAATIDWSTAKVQEKQDGSIACIYHYNDQWHVQTSGMPDASGEVNGCNFSFADLFWKTWKESGYELSSFYPHLCYSFELCTPYNRVVVPHKTCFLVGLGIRNPETGQELPIGLPEGYEGCTLPSVPAAVRSFSLQSFDDILKTFTAMNPLQQEGYVIVDGNFNRVKCKHPGYVSIHHLRDGFGPKRLLEIIRTGEAPELLTYYPEWTEHFNAIQNKYDTLVNEVTADYEKIKGIETQKDFALQAVKTRCSGALFRLRKGQITSVKEHFAEIVINNLMDMLKMRDTEVVTCE